jgi:hypothetical protein
MVGPSSNRRTPTSYSIVQEPCWNRAQCSRFWVKRRCSFLARWEDISSKELEVGRGRATGVDGAVGYRLSAEWDMDANDQSPSTNDQQWVASSRTGRCVIMFVFLVSKCRRRSVCCRRPNALAGNGLGLCDVSDRTPIVDTGCRWKVSMGLSAVDGELRRKQTEE